MKKAPLAIADDRQHARNRGLTGRGAQTDPANRFLAQRTEQDEDVHTSFPEVDEQEKTPPKTRLIELHPKTILNKVVSPDLGMAWSANPYQGCEHGCSYCYARPTHEYYGYSSGLDFETILLTKPSAPKLLEIALSRPGYKPESISFSGNTDCYQPIERKLGITRQMLHVVDRFGNPCSVITKNTLVLRDMDILKRLAERQLVHVYFSITTLDEDLRRRLEPRTATAAQKLKALKTLTLAGIPCGVMTAPVIPGLNDNEIPALVKAAADAGALSANYTMVRLNFALQEIFSQWLQTHYPGRKEKVMNQIKALHGGQVADHQFHRRMKGEGTWAQTVAMLHKQACNRHLPGRQMPAYNYKAFCVPGRQLSLF